MKKHIGFILRRQTTIKKLIFLILILILCLTSFMLISCGEKTPKFNITYELNGGTNSVENPSGYSEGDTVVLSAPVKENYFFKGWYTDSSFTNQITEIKDKAENITLYAKWVPIASYDITYQLNGGTNSAKNPDTYKTGEIITLGYPEKADYMFMGWFTDAALTTEIKEIKDREENLTLYAKWIPLEDVFIFGTAAGGVNGISAIKKDVAKTIIIPSSYKGEPLVVHYWATFSGDILEEIVFTSDVSISIYNSFSAPSLKRIIVEEENPYIKSIDGVLYSKDGKELICYPAAKAEKSYTIQDGTEIIRNGAFQNNKYVENVVVPDSVTSIGDNAFNGCTSLKNIELSKRLEEIDVWTFADCTSLEKITIPDSVQSIGVYAFLRCTSLEEIYIPDGVQVIDHEAFSSIPNITVYCETEEKPDGWVNGWNLDVKKVVWGHKESNR